MILVSIFILIVFSSLYKPYNSFIIYSNRLGILILLISILLNINIFNILNLSYDILIYNNLFKISLFTKYMELLTLLISVLLILNSSSILTNNTKLDNITIISKEYIIIILFNILGLILLPIINNLILLFIIIELQSYSLYLITSIHNNSNNSTKAGLMYFLLGGIASVFILIGISLIYYTIGELNIDYIASIITIDNNNLYINISILFILSGLFFKMGLAPFHNWSITIYNYVPTVITSWISIMAKISILTLLLNIINIFNPENNIITLYISIIIVLSLIIGSYGGINQIKIKNLLAYSGVINIGYVLITILMHNNYSIIAFILYITQYTLTHVNLFSIILLLSYYIMNNNNTISNNKNILLSIYSPIEYITQLESFYYKNKYLSLGLIISLFSLIGIPPLVGFYGKLWILISSLSSGYIFLSIILILCSVISTYYYAYIIRVLIYDKPVEIIKPNISNSVSYIISVITLLILSSFILINYSIKGANIIGMSLLFI